MPHPRALALVPIVAAAVLAGCGASGSSPTGSTATATPAASLPPLARTPAAPGEILFSREASPASHGPFSLDGRYVVRFEQFAPEDPNTDFSGQTPFTAMLRPAGSRSAGAKLFGAATASGRRELTRHGRYVLDVTFGDFPFAVRFTPKPKR